MVAEGGKKVENDMRLYHGSKSGLTGTIAPVSRDVCDFGRGFYMGTEKTQPLTLICHGESPKFYEIDYDLEGLRVYRFEANLDWAPPSPRWNELSGNHRAGHGEGVG